DIQLAERAHCLSHYHLDLIVVTDVSSFDEDPPAKPLDFLARSLCPLTIQIHHRDIRSLPGKAQGNRLADATAGTGNESHLTLELHDSPPLHFALADFALLPFGPFILDQHPALPQLLDAFSRVPAQVAQQFLVVLP